MRQLLFLGALNGALAVILGAFGAHGLQGRVTPFMLHVWGIAEDYQFYHALGLLLIGLLARQSSDDSGLRVAGWLMFAGMTVFCGSLYILVLTGDKWLGAITPIGGVTLIVSWLWLAWTLWRTPEK